MNTKIEKILSSDISVVVQGAVDKEATPLCLLSLKKAMPGAEIILSTWEGSVTEGLQFDRLVLNKDPGGIKDPFNGVTVNLNRQLCSTLNGIKVATRRYVLKTRSDLEFKNSSFTDFWNQFPERIESDKIFDHKILMSSFFCKKFIGLSKKMPVPFHIGDWVLFGTKQDMLRLWDIDLAFEPEFTKFFWMKSYSGIKFDAFKASHRLAPEQYILLEALRKNKNLEVMKHYLDYNQRNIDISHSVMMSNFIFLDPVQWCFKSLKAQYAKWTLDLKSLPEELKEGLYLHSTYSTDYKKLFGNKVENLEQ